MDGRRQGMESARPRSRPRRQAWFVLAIALLLPVTLVGTTRAHAAATSPAPMQVLQRAHWIAEGSTHPRHVLYIFIDANCPYCHRLWLALQPYYSQGLQVRHLLVGIIAPSSPGKAAAILAARDPAVALRDNERHWGSRSDGGGGIAPLAGVGNAEAGILDHDMALMQGFGFRGTPGLVYVDARGEIHAIEGSPGEKQLPGIVQAAAVPGP